MKGNGIYIKLLSISTSVIAFVLIIHLFTGSSHPEPTIVKPKVSQDNYKVIAPVIPNQINFAGEKVPVENTFVRESLDRELLVNTYWHSQTILFIKRANRYFPIIEPILKREGVPDDFKYLSLIESNFMPRAKSPAGAVGLWQFMPATAKEYGLEVNSEIDQRYNIKKATEAACKYLKKGYAKYGNWTLAAASYNAGRRGITNQLDRQKASTYYDLLLGSETGRYVYRIIAVKEILSAPEKYGFLVNPKDLYHPISTASITISGSVKNFAEFAQEHGVSYKVLKDLNPWLRDNRLTNSSKKSYEISLPKDRVYMKMKSIDPILPDSSMTALLPSYKKDN